MIYYKVVRNENGKLLSARTGSYYTDRKPVQYIPNRWVSAPENTRLFVFDNLSNAKSFICYVNGEEIWECQIIGGISGFGAEGNIISFWEKVNSYSKKKKKINFDKIQEKINLVNWEAILAKKVKLTKRVV